MKRYDRIRKAYKAEFNYGGYMSRRFHVGISNRAMIAEIRKMLRKGIGNMGPDKRDARKALYLGAIKEHGEHKSLCRQFRL